MISVIIPFFRDWPRLESTLESLLSQMTTVDFPIEVIAVDNDPDKPYSPRADFKEVRLLSCAYPGSYAARNVGINAAVGDIMVFIDSDCTPAPGFLKAVIDFYAVRNDAILTAGKITMVPLNPGTETMVEAYDCIFGLPQESYVRRGYAVTANLTIPKSVFAKIGLFDESRFSGGDADICRRATEAGHQLIYNDAAEVLHPARRSWPEIMRKVSRVVGAQVDRVGFWGAPELLSRGGIRMALSIFGLMRVDRPSILKLKSIPIVIAILILKVYYIIYYTFWRRDVIRER